MPCNECLMCSMSLFVQRFSAEYVVKGALLACKRWPFALLEAAFYRVIHCLLCAERYAFIHENGWNVTLTAVFRMLKVCAGAVCSSVLYDDDEIYFLTYWAENRIYVYFLSSSIQGCRCTDDDKKALIMYAVCRRHFIWPAEASGQNLWIILLPFDACHPLLPLLLVDVIALILMHERSIPFNQPCFLLFYDCCLKNYLSPSHVFRCFRTWNNIRILQICWYTHI